MSKNVAYETIVIFSLTDGEEAAKELVEKFKALIEANGTVDSVDEWGKRRLEYLINDEEYGYYVLYNYECNAEFPPELDRVFNITDGVLRSLIVKK
ncbi:MAG TPA: 30S ribosomal protein S6 [Clostridia bacterium]|nr:30S ribosomal protein S6 [Clostridia bacterium]